MDLTNIMKRDAAIVDHDWMKNKGGLISRGEQPLLDVEGITNPNNTKPELEVQWGGGTGPDFDFGDQDNAGVVERDQDGDGEADDVIVFARHMMNQGLMGRDLNRALNKRFARETLKKASAGLSELFKMEGIIGCIAVDGTGYKDCKEAIKAAQNSHYKAHIKYVIGCNCGTPHAMPKNSNAPLLSASSESTGNAVDDFFADEGTHREALVDHCRSTMMPILTADLDPSEVDSGMVNLMNTVGLPQDIADKAKKKKGTQALQAAFLWLQKAREARQDAEYAASVDVSEHIIKPAEPVVEINQPVAGDIEVDGRSAAHNTEVPIDKPAPSTNFDGMKDLGSEIVAELADQPDMSQIDVAMQESSETPQFQVKEKMGEAPLDVSPRGLFEEVDLAPKASQQDVDLAPDLDVEEGIFAGTDEIELEAPKGRPGELDIEF